MSRFQIYKDEGESLIGNHFLDSLQFTGSSLVHLVDS